MTDAELIAAAEERLTMPAEGFQAVVLPRDRGYSLKLWFRAEPKLTLPKGKAKFVVIGDEMLAALIALAKGGKP